MPGHGARLLRDVLSLRAPRKHGSDRLWLSAGSVWLPSPHRSFARAGPAGPPVTPVPPPRRPGTVCSAEVFVEGPGARQTSAGVGGADRVPCPGSQTAQLRAVQERASCQAQAGHQPPGLWAPGTRGAGAQPGLRAPSRVGSCPREPVRLWDVAGVLFQPPRGARPWAGVPAAAPGCPPPCGTTGPTRPWSVWRRPVALRCAVRWNVPRCPTLSVPNCEAAG